MTPLLAATHKKEEVCPDVAARAREKTSKAALTLVSFYIPDRQDVYKLALEKPQKRNKRKKEIKLLTKKWKKISRAQQHTFYIGHDIKAATRRKLRDNAADSRWFFYGWKTKIAAIMFDNRCGDLVFRDLSYTVERGVFRKSGFNCWLMRCSPNLQRFL